MQRITFHPAPTVLLHDRHILHEPGVPNERRALNERGAVTAEYAIATIAAVGFAALLVVVLRSDEVRGLLMTLIRHALALPA